MLSSKSFPQFNSESINSTVGIIQLQKIITRVMKQYNFHYYSIYKENPYPLTRKQSCWINCFDDNFHINKDIHNHLLEYIKNSPSIITARPLSWQYNLKETLPEVWGHFVSTGGQVGYSTIFKTKKSYSPVLMRWLKRKLSFFFLKVRVANRRNYQR